MSEPLVDIMVVNLALGDHLEYIEYSDAPRYSLHALLAYLVLYFKGNSPLPTFQFYLLISLTILFQISIVLFLSSYLYSPYFHATQNKGRFCGKNCHLVLQRTELLE